MTKRPDKDLFSLLRQVNATLGRGPRQGQHVKPGQNKVLKMLNKHGSMSQTEILKKLGIRSSSLYDLLRKLENDGYITRQRCKKFNALTVDITEKGRVAALESELSTKERDMTFFGKLDTTDKEDLIRILNTLLDTWEETEGASSETEAKRRERRWKENEELQGRQRDAEKEKLENAEPLALQGKGEKTKGAERFTYSRKTAIG